MRGEKYLPAGLCADCRHLRLHRTERSVFVRCALAAEDSRFPRYPRLPVLACDGYRKRQIDRAGE